MADQQVQNMNRISGAETILSQATHKPGDFLHVHACKRFYSHLKRPANFNSDVFSGGKHNSCRYSKAHLQNSVLRFSLSSNEILN